MRERKGDRKNAECKLLSEEKKECTTHVWPAIFRRKTFVFFNYRGKKSETVTTWIVFHVNLFFLRMDRSLCAHVVQRYVCTSTLCWAGERQRESCCLVSLGGRSKRAKRKRRQWRRQRRRQQQPAVWCLRARTHWNVQTEKQLDPCVHTRCVHASNTSIVLFVSHSALPMLIALYFGANVIAPLASTFSSCPLQRSKKQYAI